MDWNNIAVMLILQVLFIWVVGGIYGGFKLIKEQTWIWQDWIIAGPIFWVSYCIGRSIRRFTAWRRN